MKNMNSMNTKEVVLEHLPAEMKQYASIVGEWIWVKFGSDPGLEARSLLKEAGFHWNNERKLWQHCGGHPSRNAPYDPRHRYGEVKVIDNNPAMVLA